TEKVKAAEIQEKTEEEEIPNLLTELVMRQVRLANVVASLGDLMEAAKTFMTRHGSDGAALFLQRFSPSVKVLLLSVQKEQECLEKITETLAERNHKLQTKHAKNNR